MTSLLLILSTAVGLWPKEINYVLYKNKKNGIVSEIGKTAGIRILLESGKE